MRWMRMVVVLAVFCPTCACDLTRFTANSTSRLFERAAAASEGAYDYDLAGDAFPGTISQMEGLLRVVPDNETYLDLCMRAYIGYAYGWIEDEADQAEMDGDYERSVYLQTRAKMMYLRARDLGFHWIGMDHEGMQEAMQAGLPEFEAWLEREFDEPEDAHILLWTGYGWGAAINMGKDDMALVADLPYAKALLARSVELDEHYESAAGVTFLAVAETEALGGNLDRARQLFDRAVSLSERRSLIILYNYAKSWAVKQQDRNLFVQLLREVLEAGDVDPANRLTNVLAKRKARRALLRIEEFFPE